MSREPVPWNANLCEAPVRVVADLLGIDTRQVQRLVADRILTRSRWGRYDLHAAVRAWVQYERAGRDRDVARAAVRRRPAPLRPLPRTVLEVFLSGIPRAINGAFKDVPLELADELATIADPDEVRRRLHAAIFAARQRAIRELLEVVCDATDAQSGDSA